MADLTSEARGAVEAFNNADWDGVRKYFADSTYTEFGTQRSVSGFDALLELMQGWKAAMPDVRGTVTGAAEEGQRVVLEIMWEGTQTGELVTEQGTIPASGNRQRTPAAWVFDYEGGQLRESRHYFDMLTFLRQIGAAQLRQVVKPACKPGSVTPLSITWQYSPKCWLACGFTSHGFSSVPVSFHALAEQRRNWQIPSRVWADEEARAVLQP